MKIICEVMGYRYGYDKEANRYCVDHNDKPEVWCEEECPLVAWDYFIGTVDMAMRRRIKSALEKRGLSGWTGTPAERTEDHAQEETSG